MVTILTHSNRKRDPEHTSWSEIKAFETEMIDNFDDQTISLGHDEIDFNLLNKQPSNLFIFATGMIDDELKENVEKSSANIFIVIQDPNWPTDVRIDKPHVLITPFKALDKMSAKDAYEKLKLVTPNIQINKPEKHIYLPFGNMSITSRYYAKQRSLTQYTSIHKTSNIVYAGSLKEDRKDLFIKLVNAYPDVDFIGNFDSTDFKKMTGIECNVLHFKGRRPANQVTFIQRIYDKIAIMPDRKMIELDVSYIRYIEMYLSDAEIILFAEDDMQNQAHEIMKKNANVLPNGSYKMNNDKLIANYGLMPDMIKSKLKGSY